MSCSNPMHEDENGNDRCNGDCPDDREFCEDCEELTDQCACEDVTAETAAFAACTRGVHENGCHCGERICDCDGCNDMVKVVAVSEAEAVRRQFRDELVALLGRARANGREALEATRRMGVDPALRLLSGAGAESGTYAGGIEALLIRFCGLSAAEAMAARGAR